MVTIIIIMTIITISWTTDNNKQEYGQMICIKLSIKYIYIYQLYKQTFH